MINDWVGLFDEGVDLAYYLGIGFIAGFLCILSEACFLFGFGFQHLVVDDGLVHTDGVLPIIAAGCILAGILYADLVVGIHLSLQHSLAGTTDADARLVAGSHALLYFALGQVAVGASRETHNHGIVTFFDTLERYSQVLLRLQWYVVGAVGCRFAIGIGIDTEYREVASVAWPHPVVGFATKLTDGTWRSGYHTHIAIGLQENHIILVAGIEGECLCADARLATEVALGHFCMGQCVEIVGGEGNFFLYLTSLDVGVNLVGHIDDAFHEAESQSRSWQFFLAALGPEAITQVVVFYRAVLLDGIVATVMVGQNEAIR